MGRAGRAAAGLLNALTFPFLRPIRRVLPPIGGTLDLSPLIVIVLAQLVLMTLVPWLESGATRLLRLGESARPRPSALRRRRRARRSG